MRKLMKNYILLTYGVFYVFLLVIGITMMLFKSQIPAEILKVVSAWTSTFVFIAMFRKIYKQEKLLQFIKLQFSQRVNILMLLCLILIQVAILAGSIIFESSVHKTPINGLVITSGLSLLLIFLHNIISGPLGEELGWRGFLMNEFQKQFSPLKSGVIVGVLWGGWHTPLWLLSGYAGLQLVQYIIFFMIAIISISIIMTAFYNLNHNLFIPIIIHQLFNYFLGIQTGDQLNTLTVTALMYLLAAVIIILINYKNCLYKKA